MDDGGAGHWIRRGVVGPFCLKVIAEDARCLSFDLDRIPIAFADRDGTVASRALARAFTAAGEFADAGAPCRMAPTIRTSAREYVNPVDYRHPYESMARFAELLALRYDANRTRHAYSRG